MAFYTFLSLLESKRMIYSLKAGIFTPRQPDYGFVFQDYSDFKWFCSAPVKKAATLSKQYIVSAIPCIMTCL